MEGLYDLHSHILPHMDDGCKDAARSIEALRLSYAQGVRVIFATPHYYPVESVEVPEFAAVLVYSNSIGETLSKVISETTLRTDGTKARPLPELYFMLRQLPTLTDYNKILASYMDGYLYLAVAQGKSLLLCNSFQAPDFTSAEYFIFLVLKKLQLNPEVTTICFRTPLTDEQEMSLYRYFKSVEQI